MKCPVDQTTLVISDRQGIEIDYCPQCRGVWLDRGELDKVIERSQNYADQSHDREPLRRESYDNRHYEQRPPHKKKRGSFLGDLFEFGD